MLVSVRPHRRTTALAFALSLAAVVAAACTSATTGTAGAAAAPPPPGLERYYGQTLEWGPCAPFAKTDEERSAFADPKFECTRLEVPLDYSAPDGRTAQLGVIRQKALDANARIGSLVTNPGGPGVSGMSSLVSITSSGAGTGTLAQRFDLVGFDPRGVGASTPTIDCLNDPEWEQERLDLDVDPSPAGVAQTEAENRDYVDRCVERSGGVEVLANVGTRDAARDMDILRAALGDEKLSYLGYSYGTRLGSAYAEAFPQNVRALVLDGALDPTQSTVDRIVAQNAGFQQAFDAFAADCAKQPDCPLGTDPAQAVERFQALTRPLIEEPAAVEGGRLLSYSDALTGVTQALYLSEAWPILARGISMLAAGDGTLLMRLADLYYDRDPSGEYGNTLEAFAVISCVDEERITDREVVADLIRRATAAAPFRDDGRGVVAALDPCAFWPVPPTSEPHVPQVEGLPATLVISVTGDPATPYQAGVDLAEALGGTLLSVEGNQHTVALRGNRCVDDLVTAYLVDLQLPAGPAECTL
jgi:pimeloyl-ACP methyl ester carboxylesterase